MSELLLEKITDLATGTFERIMGYGAIMKEDAASLRYLSSMTDGLALLPVIEKIRKQNCALWEESAKHVEAAIDLIDRGPMADGDLVKMLFEMLVRQCGEEVAMERARNIAMALQNRVVREPDEVINPLKAAV